MADTLNVTHAASMTLDLLTGLPKIRAKRSGTSLDLLAKTCMANLRDEELHGPLEIVGAIQKGFKGATVGLAASMLDLSQMEVARVMDATEKTVRSMKTRKTLDQTASDKVFRLMNAYIAAFILFEDEEAARTWLKEPSEALGGAIPLDLLSTSQGETLVHHELAQMEYGHPV